jgi:hypothetical protein
MLFELASGSPAFRPPRPLDRELLHRDALVEGVLRVEHQ